MKQNFSPPIIVNKVTEFYKEIYILNKKLTKQEKFSMGRKIEGICLDCQSLSIEATLSKDKIETVKKLRIKTEILKSLIRILEELKIINIKRYLALQEKIQEISKMATGWQKYIDKEPK